MWWWSERPKNYKGQPPRTLTDEDKAGWFAAAMEQPRSPRTMESLREDVRRRNPVRWRRLQRDIRWVRKEMKRLGLNPDEWRWIL